MMIGHITLFGLAEIILTVVVLTFVEKVTPKALDAVPDKTAFKPLYILMAVLIVLTPLGLLATGTAWGEWGADEIAGLVSGGSQLGYTPSGMTNGFGVTFSTKVSTTTVRIISARPNNVICPIIIAGIDTLRQE